MKPILITVCLILVGCGKGHFVIHADGSCEAETARTTAMSCGGSTIMTGKVALDDETVRAIAEQAAGIVREIEK